MKNYFNSDNVTIILGAGASKADDGVLEMDLLNGINDLAKSLTYNIPASEYSTKLGLSNPSYSYILTYLIMKLEEDYEKNGSLENNSLVDIYNSMIEGLLNILTFSKGINSKNENHVKLFSYCFENCKNFSIISLNYDPIAESALIELLHEDIESVIKFNINFKDSLTPLPKIPPYLKPAIDPNNPRLGSWAECELTKDSIRVALNFAKEKKILGEPHHFQKKNYFNSIDFLKLHGSTRWLCCLPCGLAYKVAPHFTNIQDLKMVEFTLWMVGHHFPGFCALLCSECGAPLRPYVVPPCPDENFPRFGLEEIWSKALNNLQNSTDWLFIGYSFPEYDKEIFSLLKNALNKRRTLPNVWIIDYYPESERFSNSPVLIRANKIFSKIHYDRVNLRGLQHFPIFGNF